MFEQYDGRSSSAAATLNDGASLTVMVFHPDEMVRCGLTTMLRNVSCTGLIDTSHEPRELRTRLAAAEPDVLIVPPPQDRDIDLICATISEARDQGIAVLVLLSSSDPNLIAPSGPNVDGYLAENGLTADHLEHAFTLLRRGEMPLPTSLARELLSRNGQDQSGKNQTAPLTAREMQVLELLTEGLSNKQIARRLSISDHGAKRHVANILAKLHCPNRTTAAALAVRDNLLGTAK
ncbi:DNA-binding response regulator, NarL/FixJ family, contains REC and HTH domains [Actinopolyspora mzabensis]|uniref:DNA-binding response regulator, NarL/FixJ family, contains REC and HTH domains n=1 Tax=Actinopolyspora mzabensis TaxID=995066 RepID=A0A1G9EGT4_ACTMZ|nr:response regulator transcription factor [Actinopolyspora mzabensis]SDK75352.1 DNA-binding response regulator, NarL/FixJ family, contains REC and HTH domains [Actinopolyspora mzabensis]